MLNTKIQRRVFLVFLLMMHILCIGPVFAAKFKGKRWAVVIGVQDYKSPIPTLKSPLNDAKAVYQFLKSPEGGSFDEEHIRYLKGPEVTRDSIASALGTFLNQSDRNDYVIVYLSGHGMVEPGHTDRYYFLPSEADAGDLPASAVRMDDIYEWIQEIRASKKLIIADVCHSGAISASGAMVKGTNAVNNYLKSLGRTHDGMGVFTSSRATQLSQEFRDEEKQKDPEKNRSVFTYYLLQALGSMATEVDKGGKEDGVVDVKEAFEWVRNKVSKHTKLTQIPDFRGDNETGMPLAVVAGNTFGGSLEPTIESSREPDPANSVDAAATAWNSIKDSQHSMDFQHFINTFGQSSFYYPMAKRHYDDLIQQEKVAEEKKQKEAEASTAWSMIKDSQNPADFQGFMKAYEGHPFYFSMAKRRHDTVVEQEKEAEELRAREADEEKQRAAAEEQRKKDAEEEKQREADRSVAVGNAWSSIKNSQNPADFEDFMKAYGSDQFYYSMAKRRYDELSQQQWQAQQQQDTPETSTNGGPALSGGNSDQGDYNNGGSSNGGGQPIISGDVLAGIFGAIGQNKRDKLERDQLRLEQQKLDAQRDQQRLEQQKFEAQQRKEKEAAAEWSRIKYSRNPTDFRNFAVRYKGTRYYAAAKQQYSILRKTSSTTKPPNVNNLKACKDKIQGKVAWDYRGSKKWAEGNLNTLCGKTTRPTEPPRCFSQAMFGSIFNGSSTKWTWKDAITLCKGSSSASRTISCFKQRIGRRQPKASAISACTTR